jgi:similar to stage IV sporulation protein
MFPVGIFLCAAFLYIMSLYIWNIHIEGNYSRTTDVILDYLQSEQIVHGMRKKEVDCKQIQSMIRIEFPDIIWVSAQIKGTRLLIRVKENSDSMAVEEDTEEDTPRDIAASRDGLITSILVRSGVAQVQAGDEVEKGRLLVSGIIEILDDNGEVADYQYTAADADIYARTQYRYYDEFVLSHEVRHNTGKRRFGLYVKLGDKSCSLIWKPHYETFSVLNTEYPLKITENFYLPVVLGTIEYEEYETYTENYEENEARMLAESRLNDFLENLMQKGVQIVENDVKIEVSSNTCTASGTIEAVEEISSYTPTVMPEKEKE